MKYNLFSKSCYHFHVRHFRQMVWSGTQISVLSFLQQPFHASWRIKRLKVRCWSCSMTSKYRLLSIQPYILKATRVLRKFQTKWKRRRRGVLNPQLFYVVAYRRWKINKIMLIFPIYIIASKQIYYSKTSQVFLIQKYHVEETS